MAETHHRIKNNLQVICALIEFQEEKGSEQVTTSDLRELRQHVRSLGVIHDLLTCQARLNASVERININDAMQQLIPLLQSMAGDRKLQFAVDDAQVPVRQGTALAMLVNELVSNALKHGKEDITLSLAVAEATARLEICDGGTGFAPGFDPKQCSSTGMELIQSLSTWDLGGHVAFENRQEGGARVIVTFPIDSKWEQNGPESSA